jgi:hypothetical protein
MQAPLSEGDAALWVSGQSGDSSGGKGITMKIVVIGGTGLIGSKLVKRLRADGHDAQAASPGTGVDIITGKGWPRRSRVPRSWSTCRTRLTGAMRR